VSITGTNLPLDGFTVTIADQECDTGSHNAIETAITCSLTEVPVAGNTNVILKTSEGVVALADGVPELEIDITVTTVTTAQDLNRFGGSTVEISGTNFGYDASVISVIMTADGTVCDVYYAAGTTITCVTNEVVEISDCLDNAPTLTVTIN